MRFNQIITPALVVFLIFTVLSITKNFIQFQKIKGRILSSELRVNNLEKQRDELFFLSEKRQNEEYLEKEIRDKLKMVKNGEVLVVLPKSLIEKKGDDMYKYGTGEESSGEAEEKIYEKWIAIFK